MTSAVDDVVRVDSSTGQLTVTAPSLAWTNSSLNVSLACVSDLVRGDRGWNDLDRCVEVVWSFFTLRSVRIYGFPLEWVWPFDSLEDAAANATQTAQTAIGELAPSTTAAVGAVHTNVDDHDHDVWVYPFDLVWFFLVFGFLSLLCGASYNAYYYDDDGNLLYNGRLYKRVDTARSPPLVAAASEA